MTYRVVVTEKPYIQICRTLYELEREFTFLLLGKRRGVNIAVNEILIPYQEIDFGACKLVDKGYTEMTKAMDRIVGWGHSHPDFQAFHSFIDEETGNGASFFYTPFASITTSRDTSWDCRVFTENNGKKGKKADLYLPQAVPMHKFKKKRKCTLKKLAPYVPSFYEQENTFLGRTKKRIVGVFGGGGYQPPFNEDLDSRVSQLGPKPSVEYCEGCVHFSETARRCKSPYTGSSNSIFSLKECPLNERF